MQCKVFFSDSPVAGDPGDTVTFAFTEGTFHYAERFDTTNGVTADDILQLIENAKFAFDRER
jgi:hypothetical protein